MPPAHQDSGGTTPSVNFGQRHSNRITTDAPIVLDPTNHDVVYFGGNVLDRSTDQGATFTQISPPGDFLTGPVPPDENDQGPFYANEYATITSIAPAKTDGNTIYVGTDTGRLWKTTDLGATWSEFTGKGLPVRWVNSIVVDPTDANHVFVAYSGYREGDTAANVWETTNGGQTWANISGKLPNAPVEMLAFDQAPRPALCGNRPRRLLRQERKAELEAARARPAEYAGARHQDHRRRSVDVRGDVRPQRVEDRAAVELSERR